MIRDGGGGIMRVKVDGMRRRRLGNQDPEGETQRETDLQREKNRDPKTKMDRGPGMGVGERDRRGGGQRPRQRDSSVYSGSLCPLTHQPGLRGRGHGAMRFQKPAMVGQEQPQSHMKCKDQGSPQTRGKECSCQEPLELIVLSAPGREKKKGALKLCSGLQPRDGVGYSPA